MDRPLYYIKTFFEPREGFRFDQPVERLNGKSYYEYEQDSYERKNWGTISWDSKKYNDALDYSQFYSELWTNEEAKLQAFTKIYNFIKDGKSGSGSSITGLFPFEIFLMNDGFEMISFTELNAINPGVGIICDKIVGDEIINPRGLRYLRTYLKDDNFIYLGFGIEFDKKKTNFYFQTSKDYLHHFQVDNTIENYEKAINGKLPFLDS